MKSEITPGFRDNFYEIPILMNVGRKVFRVNRLSLSQYNKNQIILGYYFAEYEWHIKSFYQQLTVKATPIKQAVTNSPTLPYRVRHPITVKEPSPA